MVTVYVDVLVVFNWFVNYFLLLGVSKIAKTPIVFWRNLLSSFLLGLGSLTLFLPAFSVAVELLVRLLFALVGVLVAFGYHSIYLLVKRTAAFFAATFAFGGIMLGLWSVFHPKNMVLNNGAYYMNCSPIALVGFTVVSYCILWLLRKQFGKEEVGEEPVILHKQCNGKTITFYAKVDTGFTLEDVYTHQPLVFLSPTMVKRLALEKGSPKRLLPFETVNGGGLVETLSVDGLTAQYKGKTVPFSTVSVALGTGEFHGAFDALVGLDFLERMNQCHEQTAKIVANHCPSLAKETGGLHQRLGYLTATLKTRRRTTTNGTTKTR